MIGGDSRSRRGGDTPRTRPSPRGPHVRRRRRHGHRRVEEKRCHRRSLLTRTGGEKRRGAARREDTMSQCPAWLLCFTFEVLSYYPLNPIAS